MPLKLNLRPKIEEEMERLLPLSGARSKTDYINRAVEAYNDSLRRQKAIEGLKEYFKQYSREAKTVMDEFAKVRNAADD